jgi:hypothetical protein
MKRITQTIYAVDLPFPKTETHSEVSKLSHYKSNHASIFAAAIHKLRGAMFCLSKPSFRPNKLQIFLTKDIKRLPSKGNNHRNLQDKHLEEQNLEPIDKEEEEKRGTHPCIYRHSFTTISCISIQLKVLTAIILPFTQSLEEQNNGSESTFD